MADIGHRIATELVDEEKSDRARLFERLAQFLCLERGVGGDQYDPVRAQAHSISTHSGEFGDQTTMCSPGLNRVESASAKVSLSASNAL